MLNTDQHNPTLTRRMKLEDFVRNNKTINNGDDLPLDFQEQVCPHYCVYDSAELLRSRTRMNRNIPSCTQVFLAIQNREIKVGAGVGDTDALAEQWDGVVKRSQSQAGAAFASSQLADGEVSAALDDGEMSSVSDTHFARAPDDSKIRKRNVRLYCRRHGSCVFGRVLPHPST